MKTVNLPALGKELYHIRADPNNPSLIEDASLQEREGFGTGVDPMELPEVLSFIAENGHVWLQYATEDKKLSPTGVIEFISLKNALTFDPEKIKTEFDINASPLTVITRNQDRVFLPARNFADDDDILYHHGIAMSRRGQGYGTLLLRHALGNTGNARNKFISCYIDAAKIDENGKQQPAANESSYTVHMKEGFVVVGVVEPPVYESNITYYSTLRPSDSKPLRYGSEQRTLGFDNPNVGKTINDVRELVSAGFVGVAYDKKSHEMIFRKLA